LDEGSTEVVSTRNLMKRSLIASVSHLNISDYLTAIKIRRFDLLWNPLSYDFAGLTFASILIQY
jgi:hypothetical protein